MLRKLIGRYGKIQAGIIGVLAQGYYPNSSLNFEFSNNRFSNFTVGIKVDALERGSLAGNWQFDNVKLEHSTFESCQTGVYINSFNSGWQVNSIEFYSGANSYGFYIDRISYSTIDSLIGNGTVPPAAPAKALLYIGKRAAALDIRNSVSEGFEYDLLVEGNDLTSPLNLHSNFFQAKVQIENATVVSVGNQFGVTTNGGLYVAPQPIAKGYSRVTSIGDKFCSEGGTNCATGGWVLQDQAGFIFTSDQVKNFSSRPFFMSNYISITSDLPEEPTGTVALLSLIAPSNGMRPLLRLGQPTANYTVTRDQNVGWLSFAGNQVPQQYVGYKFDGPVRLPAFQAANLPPVLEEGAMVFCKFCQPNSSPCQSGGPGALAISIGSNWVCK